MDPNFAGSRDLISGYTFSDDRNHRDLDESYRNPFNFASSDPFYQSDVNPLSFGPVTTTSLNSEGTEAFHSSSDVSTVDVVSDVPFMTMTSLADPSLEDTDFSETFKYISQILMEENSEQKPSMYYDPQSLHVTEKSFYNALKEKLPLSLHQHPLDIHQNLESPDGNSSGISTDSSTSTSTSSSSIHANHAPSPDTPVSGDHAFQFNSHSISHTPCQLPLNALTNISDGMLELDSSISKLLAQNIFSEADSVSQFRRGLEEASKFLPQRPQLVTGLERTTVSQEPKGDAEKAAVNMDKAVSENLAGFKSRKNHERQNNDGEEERSNKQSAVSVDEGEITEMFDRVLLSVENVPLCAKDESLRNVSVKATLPTEQSHSSDGGKIRSKKQGMKKETVDLRTLLILCAQAVAANDCRTANDLLKQIRQHSTPFGDASQRLAHYFANGLEARLVGADSGSQIFYTALSYKRLTAAEFLKAYQVFISACPFKKFAHCFANKMIMKAVEKEETLHIIDFGIFYGFQWPILIKFLSKRRGGPPKLRITGIEFPQAGFRPAERIEETGRRLDNYCKRFNVPFEYNAIASRNWETIQIEDLKIKNNELLAVNCLIRFKNLLDETIEVNSPRNAVLNLIRKLNPAIFVQSSINGSYNAPFFVTRFREALFHYSALYDMYDTLIPRENEWRLMIEREFSGREVMNVVACEGFERVERPETYKQWQVRNTRAGFKQLPLDKELMVKFEEKFREWYHRDFVFDQDNNWMLQGWKGRILYASSCWVPA